MAGSDNYYLLTALPSLGRPGSPAPLRARELLERVRAGGSAAELAEALLLGDDLLQREALLAGELDRVDPIILSPAQARDEEPLPQYLAAEAQTAPRVAADAVWAAYYRHVTDVAQRRGSRFLAAWVGFEVALRNELAAVRARALDLDPQAYLVATELAETDMDLRPVWSEWSSAANPLAALKVLDLARWRWLTEHDAWFTFGDDEIAAYTAKLMLILRWHRLTEAQEEAAFERAAQPQAGN
jgi:hypothetical protein